MYYFYRLTFVSPSFTVYEGGKSLHWYGDNESVSFYILLIKTFFWGIRGNQKADSTAKSALDLPRVKVGVPYTDFKHHINQYILST